MSEKSLVGTAYGIMTDRYDCGEHSPIPFGELCQAIIERLGLSESDFLKEVSRFYTDMTLDGRFVIRENNTWTLREHERYKDVHIDMNDVYADDDSEETEEKKVVAEEKEEEGEFEEPEERDENYDADDDVVLNSEDDFDENN